MRRSSGSAARTRGTAPPLPKRKGPEDKNALGALTPASCCTRRPFAVEDDLRRTLEGSSTLIPTATCGVSTLPIEGLRSALSAERLSAYALPEDTDEVDCVARYLWNLALCSALHPALHTLEITVRNRLFDISRRIVDETNLSFDKVSCWLDARPSLLADPERDAVEKAKATILRRRSSMTEGRPVSVLGFGFRVSLCKRSYEQGRVGAAPLA